MQIQTLAGTTAPKVGLGCMGMSDFYGHASEDECLRALHLAFELGYRHLDTADFYGDGHNERLIGRFVRELGSRRRELLIATKCGLRRKAGPTPGVDIDSSPAYVKLACEASLARLGIEAIDLFYLHRRSPSVPIEDTVGAMAELVKLGKIRAIGLSEVSAQTLRAASKTTRITAVQSELSLWTRDAEAHVLPACAELGVDFVAYSPLGRGFLTGELNPATFVAANDLRQHLPRFAPGNYESNLALLAAIDQVSAEVAGTRATVALAWVLAQAPNVSVIPGARKPAHVRSNFESLSVSLNTAQLARLSEAFSPAKIAGERYPQALLSTVNV
ncbi:MAG: hypothetical protein RL701_1245 [Pseudomonadota bacterium]|jgi:aryl-alcohol dehydrogenase-like predicted oxidoreductase